MSRLLNFYASAQLRFVLNCLPAFSMEMINLVCRIRSGIARVVQIGLNAHLYSEIYSLPLISRYRSCFTEVQFIVGDSRSVRTVYRAVLLYLYNPHDLPITLEAAQEIGFFWFYNCWHIPHAACNDVETTFANMIRIVPRDFVWISNIKFRINHSVVHNALEIYLWTN